MIKAIIFDLWNTLVTGSKTKGIISKDLEKRLKEFNFNSNHFWIYGHRTWMVDGVGNGKIYFEDYLKFINIDKRYLTSLNEYFNASTSNIKPIKGIPSLIKKLRENGYKIGLISNTGIDKEEFEKLAFSKYFDVKTYSYLERIVKPNPNIYCRTLTKLNVEIFNTIFVDDIREFIDGAKYLGIDGILFKNVKNLKEELVKRGIKL